ncbi:WalN protein [Paenibacillus algicola]|uniref:WalN protein n=2 Tax=Paenibacillus algicola TaxID=2565926 RepID=A0A4P8XHW8_9BACL|nr:WalN protein [Paenibacillus algicola]
MVMSSKPKLLLFSHLSNPDSITGAEKLLLFFCRELLPYFDCVLVAPGEGRLTALARESGVPVRIWPLPLLYSVYTPSPQLKEEARRMRTKPVYRRLVRWMAKEAPDLILTNTCVHYLPAAAGKALGIPVIWKLNEVMMDNGFLQESAALIDTFSDWILGISQSVVQCFSEPVRSSKCFVLYPSWNEEELQPAAWTELREQRRAALGVDAGMPLIGVVSSFLVPNKGIADFVEMGIALKERNPQARFWIVGSVLQEEYYAQLQARITEAGAAERFLITGSQEQLEPVYSALDILVVPSRVPEGFGLTALEGMVHGKPVVAYAHGGLKELLEAAGSPALLAEPGNPGALADAVQGLLEDAASCRALGESSRGNVLGIFGPQMYRMRLQELISRWVLERPLGFQKGAERRKSSARAVPVKRGRSRRSLRVRAKARRRRLTAAPSRTRSRHKSLSRTDKRSRLRRG